MVEKMNEIDNIEVKKAEAESSDESETGIPADQLDAIDDMLMSILAANPNFQPEDLTPEMLEQLINPSKSNTLEQQQLPQKLPQQLQKTEYEALLESAAQQSMEEEEVEEIPAAAEPEE